MDHTLSSADITDGPSIWFPGSAWTNSRLGAGRAVKVVCLRNASPEGQPPRQHSPAEPGNECRNLAATKLGFCKVELR